MLDVSLESIHNTIIDNNEDEEENKSIELSLGKNNNSQNNANDEKAEDGSKKQDTLAHILYK